MRSKVLHKLDRLLTRLLPLRYAYGFLAVAEASGDGDESTRMAQPPAPGQRQ